MSKKDSGAPKMKKKAMPVKTTLNLVIKEKKSLPLAKTIPAVLIVLALAVVFGKFAVADRYEKLNAAEKELSNARSQLNALRASYTDYDEVQAEYNRYTYNGFDRTIVNRLDVMALIEREIFPVSGVRSLSITGKTVSMTLTGMTLEEISRLIDRLEKDPLTEFVVVSTAGYGGGENDVPTASMTLTLADATTLNNAEGSEG